MNRLNLDLYKVIEFGLGNDTWQEWVDRYEEKFDQFVIDGFDFAPMSLDYTWRQLIASTGATTLPAYVDPESPAYEAALRQLEGKTGNLPTMKRFYRLNRVTLQQQMQLIQRVGASAMDAQMQKVFMGLMDESTDGLIQSYYNALTHQRMRVVSTGQFTIDDINNPRGIQGITLTFNVPTKNASTLTNSKRWWTDEEHTPTNEGADADPITDMKNWVKEIRRKHHYYGAIEMELAQDLWDDLATHTAVLKRVGASLYPQINEDATLLRNVQNEEEERIKSIIKKLIKVDVITPRETYAYVDKPGTNEDGLPDLVQVQIENFKKENISFHPTGKLGTIQGVEPIELGYEPSKVASFNEGRLKLTQRAIPETHSIYIESEAAQLCVPSVPQFMFIKTVTV